MPQLSPPDEVLPPEPDSDIDDTRLVEPDIVLDGGEYTLETIDTWLDESDVFELERGISMLARDSKLLEGDVSVVLGDISVAMSG
jgi:hypothetical protein